MQVDYQLIPVSYTSSYQIDNNSPRHPADDRTIARIKGTHRSRSIAYLGCSLPNDLLAVNHH